MMSTARMGGRQYIVCVVMAQRSASAADVTRHAVNLARAMTIGLRSWGFYPPEHPAVALAVYRLIAASTDAGDLALVECAELLHDRDIRRFIIVAPPSELNTEELGVVTLTPPEDPFRPLVKLIVNGKAETHAT